MPDTSGSAAFCCADASAGRAPLHTASASRHDSELLMITERRLVRFFMARLSACPFVVGSSTREDIFHATIALVACVFEHVVARSRQWHFDLPGPSEELRIVNHILVVDRFSVDPRESLDGSSLFGGEPGGAGRLERTAILVVCRFDDKPLTFPPAAGISVPSTARRTEIRTSLHGNH